MRNTYDLFPIKYHHVHIRDHGDIFGQLIDECPGTIITITEPTPIEFDNDIDNNGFINSSFSYFEIRTK